MASSTRRRRRPAWGIAVAVVVGCATSPLGRSQVMLYPDSELAQMGEAAFQQTKREVPISRDRDAKLLVQCVSKQVLQSMRAENAPQSWEVQVFEDDDPNAFALPGGKIGVNTGMLDVVENQEQLAAVIGHEIGHVIARHANERISTTALAETGLGLTQIAVGANSPESRQLFGLLGAGTEVGILLPFSRTQESEADVIGLRLMAQAGFDPRQAVRFWQVMERVGGGGPPEFLSTHPSGESRVETLTEHVPEVLPIYQRVAAQGRPACETTV